MRLAYPSQVKSLTEDRYERPNRRRRHNKNWLDIAGPFCMYPKQQKSNVAFNQIERIKSSLSQQLGVSVEAVYNKTVVKVMAVVTDDVLSVLRAKEYKRQTKR